MAILVHQDDNVPWNVMIVSMIPLIRDPKSELITVPPTPPVSSVPPMTAAAMASISNPRASLQILRRS